MASVRGIFGNGSELPEEVEELQEEVQELEEEKKEVMNDLGREIKDLEEENDDLRDRLEYSEELEELDPPDFQDTTWPGEGLYRAWKYKRKRRKLTSEGYIQWYLVDDTFPEPKYIKPEAKGGGLPEYEHDGVTYVFPTAARLPSEEQGMWTVIHRRGEADPINLRDPNDLAIPADVLDEYLSMRPATSPPGLLDALPFDMDDGLRLMVIGIIVFALFQEVLGGGF